MATIKSFTDLPQSKVLAEFLPIESADMYWWSSGKRYYIESIDDDDYEEDKDIRAWSLAALLNILPDTITSNNGIAFKLNIKKNIIEYSNPPLYLIYKSVKSDNIVDACYEMILKLHEQNLL